jgi:hypothetical protein
VTVIGPDEVEMDTTYWRIFSQERSGRLFIVRKANGEWAIGEVKAWMSLEAML